jgi:hypothetical protein
MLSRVRGAGRVLPPPQPRVVGLVLGQALGSLVVIAQQKPARWRATATATSVLRLPRWLSRPCQM